MTEPPGGWELQRSLEQLRADSREGFKGLNERLDKLVSQDAFQAEQRRRDEQIADLRADIAEERTARIAALKDEKQGREKGDQTQQAQLDKLTTTLRIVAVSVLLPIALFIANFILITRSGP